MRIGPIVIDMVGNGERGVAAITAPQHMEALQRAHEVRLARAELKRRVYDGNISVGEVTRTCPWEAASMTIGELLLSQPRWGVARCRKFLAASGVPETKTIGSMTSTQREALAAIFEGSRRHRDDRARAAHRQEIPTSDPSDTPSREDDSGVAASEAWAALEAAGRDCERLAYRLQKTMTQRDARVLALSQLGASRRSVATVARITVGRVQQIVTAGALKDQRASESASTSSAFDDG